MVLNVIQFLEDIIRKKQNRKIYALIKVCIHENIYRILTTRDTNKQLPHPLMKTRNPFG